MNVKLFRHELGAVYLVRFLGLDDAVDFSEWSSDFGIRREVLLCPVSDEDIFLGGGEVELGDLRLELFAVVDTSRHHHGDGEDGGKICQAKLTVRG
jgi:hypothetical protein